MRLVVDLSAAQGFTRHRSIGRYAIGLTKALAANITPDDDLHVLLSDPVVGSASRLRKEFANVVPAERIHELISFRDTVSDEREARRLHEGLRTTVIATLRPDVLLSIDAFPDGLESSSVAGAAVLTATIVEDAVAWPWNDAAAGVPEALKRSDLIFTTSDSVRERLMATAAIEPTKIVTIGSAIHPQFVARTATDADLATLERRGVVGRYVLCVSDLDDEKDIDLLIEAFARLEPEMRGGRQLVIVCNHAKALCIRLQKFARVNGLLASQLVLVESVTDHELSTFYRCCELFVAPAPSSRSAALEAHGCGASVLAIRDAGLEDVVAERDLLVGSGAGALFEALERALRNPLRLAAGRERRSSIAIPGWDTVAGAALDALRALAAGAPAPAPAAAQPERLRLALLTPLPPARTGIADYCLELIPALHAHYAVEVVVDQEEIDLSWVPESMPIRSVAWFEEHAQEFDRILYQFGNSSFHQHMFGLLERFPGVVMLHDFFLGDALNWMQAQPGQSTVFDDAVRHAHGSSGELLAHEADRGFVVGVLPCSLSILESADRVIVHSQYAKRLARSHYGASIERRFVVLPFPRALQPLPERRAARCALKVDEEDILICSFGIVGPHKLIHVIILAFFELPEAVRSRCRLVMVGADHPFAYGDSIRDLLTDPRAANIEITGHVSAEVYRRYLGAADIAVQLRGSSRGETSAAVFDALGAGLPLIVNRHASLGELPEHVVMQLEEQVVPRALATALEELIADPARRRSMGAAGRRLVGEAHDPVVVARQYVAAIEEAIATSPRRHLKRLEDAVVSWMSSPVGASVLPTSVALAVTRSTRLASKKRLFIDVTAVAEADLKTGIQRTVRALVLELLRKEPSDWRVELVRADRRHRLYRFASGYLHQLLGRPVSNQPEEVLDSRPGDLFLGLDLSHDTVVQMPEWFRHQHERGMRMAFVVYDLLPVEIPEFFPPGANSAFGYWLETIAKAADEVICISEATADAMIGWLERHQPMRRRPLRIGSFRLGADLGASAPTRGLPPEAERVKTAISARRTFLTVGTVEPRKGHVQLLDAFQLLWAAGEDVGLVIVGKLGWMMDDFQHRVSCHPELGKRLFWLERISDEFLEALYPICAALIAPSRGEGFGLPLIEAAQHGLPIIARDLKVFREVAGDHAYYFDGLSSDALADALQHWLSLDKRGLAPTSEGVRGSSWADSARELLDRLAHGTGYREWQFRACMSYGERLGFDSPKLDFEGWYPAEPTHRWSRGKQARIGFLPPPGNPEGCIELLCGTRGFQRISILLNGLTLFDESGDWPERGLTLRFPPDALTPGEENWIDIRIPDGVPHDGHDVRALGLYIRHIAIF